MENVVVLLAIALPFILIFFIRCSKTQKRRIELAKHQAHIIEEEIRSKCCSKCHACKEFGGNDELVIYVRKKNRYIFYTYSCIAVHNSAKELLQCEYNTNMELILNENAFDLWKKWWDCSDVEIYKAIDYKELIDNSNKIYQTIQ